MNPSHVQKITDMFSAIREKNLPFELFTETGKNLADIDYRRVNCGSGMKLRNTQTNEYYDSKGKDTISFPVTISVGVAYRIIIDAIKAMSSPITLPVDTTPLIAVETVEPIATTPTTPLIVLASAYTSKEATPIVQPTLPMAVETVSVDLDLASVVETPNLKKGKTNKTGKGRKITLK